MTIRSKPIIAEEATLDLWKFLCFEFIGLVEAENSEPGPEHLPGRLEYLDK